jgi:hypothetical protein
MSGSQAVTIAAVAVVSWTGTTAPTRISRDTALTEDQIVVSQATARDAAMVLVHGQRSEDKCPDAEAMAGAGTHVIENVASSSGCQVVVFSRYHPLLEDTPQWTDGSDVVPLTLAGDPQAIELNIFIASGQHQADGWARADLRRASLAYRRNRVGVTFAESKFVPAGALTAAEIGTIGDGCSHADEIRRNFPQYDATRLNVFYVAQIDGDEWLHGYNCFDQKVPKPNIIFISLASRAYNTLAHELGHALGLQFSTGHTGSEDVAEIDGFGPTNIMWGGLSSSQAKSQKHFSLGQAYRMNADGHSWLHASKSGPAGAALPARPCHPSGPANRTPCPALAFDVP